MVCNRCKSAVQVILENQGCHVQKIELGEVEIIEESLSSDQLQTINTLLIDAGFELIDDRKSRIIEKIKNTVITLVHYSDDHPKGKQSELISKELHYDYSYLSKLFSEIEGITIEQYIIHQKIEKVKEYLVYDELNLNEIAYRMGYSSSAHLSAQFKKITGLPPGHFKNLGASQRKSLDKTGAK